MHYTCCCLHYCLVGFRLKRQTHSYVMLLYSFLETRTISVSCSTCPNLSYVCGMPLNQFRAIFVNARVEKKN